VIPASLNIDPDLSVVRTLSFPVAGELLFIIGGLVLGLVALRRYPHPGFAILWFLFHTFLVYTVAARTDVINERHLYLGSWGLCLLFALALARALRAWPSGKKALCLSACCVVLLLMGATVTRNSIYASEVLLWEDTVKKSPAKARVHNNLGYAYYLSGNLEKAREAYVRALELNPGSVVTRNNLLQLDAGEISPPRTDPPLPPRI
jgi:tetratricopeptide (TPR) repeat protein